MNQEKDQGLDDSPYLTLIQTRKIAKPVLSFSRRLINDENDGSSANRVAIKRPESFSGTPILGLANKKCRCSHQAKVEEIETSPAKRKEKEAKIMKAVQKSDEDHNLIGDFTRPYLLPIASGKHSDLKTISPETLASLLQGKFKDLIESITIIDARYPYEFEGGHVIGARNIFEKQALLKELLDNQIQKFKESSSSSSSSSLEKANNEKRHILIFHCEFSSERGPTLSRFLRNKDREYNTSRYPFLFYPEIYLLGGGYKAFYQKYKELCTPQNYLPMLSKNHKDLLRFFRSKSKNPNCDSIKWSSSGGILRCQRKYKS